MQRVEWINLIIAQVWPYLDGFLKLVLQSVEEDSNLKSRLAGYHIHSLSFPHGSLGKIPPKLAGIKFHQATHRDEVILGTIDTLLTYYIDKTSNLLLVYQFQELLFKNGMLQIGLLLKSSNSSLLKFYI